MENNLSFIDIKLKKMCEEVLYSISIKDMVAIRFSVMIDILRLYRKNIISEDDRYFWIDYVYDLCKEHIENNFSNNPNIRKNIIHKCWYE